MTPRRLQFVFRANAGKKIGTGHARRCLAVAQECQSRGAEIAFLCNSEAIEVVPELGNVGANIINLENEGEGPNLLSNSISNDRTIMVFDDYNIDASTESLYRPFVSRIAVIDDLANRPHDCDMLFDVNFGRNASDYAKWVPTNCITYVGPKYQIIRDTFKVYETYGATRDYEAPKTLNVLVCLGGTDPNGITEKVIQDLSILNAPISLDVVVGSDKNLFNEVRSAAIALSIPYKLHLKANNIEAMMAAADFAIGAAGTMTWERNYMGLPTIMFIIADNQILVGNHMERTRAAIVFDARKTYPREGVSASVSELCLDRSRLKSMSLAALANRPERSVERIVDILVSSAS